MHENSDNFNLYEDNDPELGEEYADWIEEIHSIDIAEDLNSCYIDPSDIPEDPYDLDDVPF